MSDFLHSDNSSSYYPATVSLQRDIYTLQSVTLYLRIGTVGVANLSPGVSLIYDLAHDGGILQSELFTSRNQNLVSGKLWKSGFWRCS